MSAEAATVAQEGAALIDGKAIAKTVRAELKSRVDALKQRYGKGPGLGVLLVGERKDSATYVRMKKRAAAEVGIESFTVEKPATATQDELIKAVQELNANPAVHGILVQLPLPEHIDEQAVLGQVSYEKDVDGLHPMNQGLLMMRGRTPLFVSCTPSGCIELLDRTGVAIEGKNAVVLGRSNIVGMPVAMLLQQRNATVTMCHSRTANLADEVRRADIVIAAIGKANAVTGDMLKPGAAVIDVGMNAVSDDSVAKGYRLVGDCDFASCSRVAGHITPVPGGVGPMTIAMLLRNTVDSSERYLSKQ